MSATLWVALGSALGGAARYWAGIAAARWLGLDFPWGTLFVNVAGSFVIGVFATLSMPDGRAPLPDAAILFVMVGICGGFTTFSAFSLQTLGLMHEGEWLRAGAYVLASVALCLLAVWLGQAAGRAT